MRFTKAMNLRTLRNLLLVGLIAAFAFGGSFECHSSSGHRDDDRQEEENR